MKTSPEPRDEYIIAILRDANTRRQRQQQLSDEAVKALREAAAKCKCHAGEDDLLRALEHKLVESVLANDEGTATILTGALREYHRKTEAATDEGIRIMRMLDEARRNLFLPVSDHYTDEEILRRELVRLLTKE